VDVFIFCDLWFVFSLSVNFLENIIKNEDFVLMEWLNGGIVPPAFLLERVSSERTADSPQSGRRPAQRSGNLIDGEVGGTPSDRDIGEPGAVVALLVNKVGEET